MAACWAFRGRRARKSGKGEHFVRLNGKALAAGLLLMAFAIVGFWINLEDHAIGTARRMGPGYMPMLAFGILGALAAITIATALFSGPDPLDRWTQGEILAVFAGIATALAVTFFLFSLGGAISRNWYPLGIGLFLGCLVFSIPPGWRKLGLVIAALVLFGITLELGGLFLAIALCVGLAATADETQTVKGALALIIFQIVLCWVVFIRELDIRVNVWPQLF
jgi:hypothetical protein